MARQHFFFGPLLKKFAHHWSSRCRARLFFSPSVLNTGNSKNSFNETGIKKLSTSLGSVNCETHKHTDTHRVVKLCGTPRAAKCRVPGIGGRVSVSVATSVWGTGQHKHENRNCCITRKMCCLTPFWKTCVHFLAPESFFWRRFSLFLLRSVLLAHSHCYKYATKTVLSDWPSGCNR